MLNSNESIHHTVITPIKGNAGEGWEISCVDCDFRTRYYYPECSDEVQLEIVSLGDANARHSSESVNLASQSVGSASYADDENFVEDEWLTPEIRQTLQGIVRKLDD
jgi:hypothetical protein